MRVSHRYYASVKLKQRPEDFRVEEINALEPGSTGPFALYRLQKSGIGTPEALRLVAKEWRARPSFAGLKDRHGKTGQIVSLRDGPKKNFVGDRFKLNYLGRSPRPSTRSTLVGNTFRIVVRDLAPDEAERFAARAAAVAVHGFANYYDDQRFGSLRGTGGAFIARAFLDGDDERALKLAVASPARQDRSDVRRRRALLRDRWGDWAALAAEFERSFERLICERLAAGATWREAYGEIDPALRSLHLAAYQASLFNEELRQVVGGNGPSHPGVCGDYRFYRGDPGPLRDRRFPLAVFEGLDFRAGERGAVVTPSELTIGDPAPDDLNAGRLALPLAFTLPPGAYATMVVKRCSYDM